MRVMDLPGWVPEASGAKSYGDRAPGADEVFIERVLKVLEDHILFSCRFVDWSTGKGVPRSVFYDFKMLDEKVRPKIKEILNENKENTLLSIGMIEIPAD